VQIGSLVITLLVVRTADPTGDCGHWWKKKPGASEEVPGWLWVKLKI